MGNILQRIEGKPSARLILPDGIIVEYYYRVQVAMLMMLHPNYLVVSCQAQAVAPNQQRQIKVIDPEDRLCLGESYVMYPIPPQYKELCNFAAPLVAQTSTKASDFPLCFPSPKLDLARFVEKKTVKGTRSGRARWWWVTLSQHVLFPSHMSEPGKVKDGGWVPLFNSAHCEDDNGEMQELESWRSDPSSFQKLDGNDP